MDWKTNRNIIQLVCFHLANEEYGVDILKIREIIKVPFITRIPHTASFVRGVINLRGMVIPVIDLRKRFGIQMSENTSNMRIIVVDQDLRMIGMIVDGVSRVLRITPEQIEPTPPVVAGVSADYIIGVTTIEGKLHIILDMKKVLVTYEGRRNIKN